ncbi:hypothetical protein DFP73DRAFT_525735 [Morchella snyderi]|nr:hypothetical protein DFP73DRAFT_525735 [Morchella snyderi]
MASPGSSEKERKTHRRKTHVYENPKETYPTKTRLLILLLPELLLESWHAVTSRLPVPPEEHDDSQTDGTRSSQSTSTQSSQSTTAPIARKGLLRSSDTSTGRSSPRRVEFHLSDGNTDSAEVQEQQENVPEVEETADTSYSEYDDSPENDHDSSEENLDDPEEEPQASTQRSQSTGKRPRTVQPTTARALGNAQRRPAGAVAEVIASSDVSVDVRGTRPGAKVIRRLGEGPGRAAPTSAPRQNAFQRTPTASQRALTSAPSQEASQRAFPASQRAFPESQRTLPIPSQSMPSSVPVYSRNIDFSSSTRHINLSSMRSRYGDSSPTYRPYHSSPPFEGVGESSMSSPRIPSSPQVYLPEAQPRVYDIAQLSSSIREEENAPIAESEAQRIEKECSTLIGDHTLLHERFPPAARLSVLVVSMWAAASRRVGCTVDLDEVVIKQLRTIGQKFTLPSPFDLMHEVKGRLADSTIYGLGNLSGPEARAAQVDITRYDQSHRAPGANPRRAPENAQTALANAANRYYTYRLRFLAPEIIDILYYKYFDGVRMRGVKDPEFLERITPTFICLISTAIWHGIRAWSTGTYVKPDHFESQNENVVSKHPRSLTAITRTLRAVKDALETTECFESGDGRSQETFNWMSNTWEGRSRQNQEATLAVIKDNLREKIREKKGITIEVIPEDGFSEDDKALVADLEAFRNARKAPPSALVDPSGSDNGGSQEEVVHAQLRGIEAEEEVKENEEEQERGITKEARRKRMCREPASALESTPEHFGGECFGEHSRALWRRVLWRALGALCRRVLWRALLSALEASALESTGSTLEASALESTGSTLEASAL